MRARQQALLNASKGEQSAPLPDANRKGAEAVSVPLQLPSVESQQSTRLRPVVVESTRGSLQPIEVSGSHEIPRPIAQPELQNIRSFIRPGAALSSSSFLQPIEPIENPRPISSMSSSEVPRRLHVTATRSYLEPAAASAAPAQVRQQVTQQVSERVVSAAQSVNPDIL